MRKNYFFFSLPLILSALLSQSYSFINSMMIGEYLGSKAFAATAVTSLFLGFVNTFLTGYHQGTSIYFSILFGKNENGKMLFCFRENVFCLGYFYVIFREYRSILKKDISSIQRRLRRKT